MDRRKFPYANSLDKGGKRSGRMEVLYGERIGEAP
jgi:hypothetical protein